MTLTELQRAAAVLYAAREAGPTGSLPQMKAICYVLRNRFKNAWGESWLAVVESAPEFRGNPPGEELKLDLNDRRLQLLARDIDDIYFGSQIGDEIAEAVANQLFWCFIDRPITEWFEKNIIRDNKHHPSRAQVGMMMLYE